MSKFVSVAITIYQNVLVEVADDSQESVNLAIQLAEELVDGDVGDIEIADIFDDEPNDPFDNRVYIEDYILEDDE